jgi:hypothetical protein
VAIRNVFRGPARSSDPAFVTLLRVMREDMM